MTKTIYAHWFIRAAAAGLAVSGGAFAGETRPHENTLLTQKSLTDTPRGPKEQLGEIGVTPDIWVTQFYQGQPRGDGPKTWAYGGKMDAFLKVDGEKLGGWRGFHLLAQYEHYFGRNINHLDTALLPVNAAQAFVARESYHSALSLVATQEFGENLSISAGKVNTMTLASQTPLVGGGGMDTFMNRAFAAPATGIGVTTPGTIADRLIVAPTYTLGASVALKTQWARFTFAVADPRNAQNSRVLERPFEKGVTVVGAVTIPTKIAGLPGFHTFRGAYGNARGLDLDDVAGLRRRLSAGQSVTKKGYWFASYSVQQYLFQSAENPGVGWGLFGLATLSDGNPNPVKWSMHAGLAGNNLIAGRDNDRWGVGYFHHGLTTPLLAGLAAGRIYRQSESGVEGFYNWAITPWLRLTADLQLVDPWNATRARAAYTAVRLQTKF